jgi:hypothetical protein
MPKILEQNDIATVDYPQEGESICSRHYSFRISAYDAEKVKVSIDDGRWQSCRNAAGYYWFDWSDYLPGYHEVVVKVQTADGRQVTTEPRRFRVEYNTTNNNNNN